MVCTHQLFSLDGKGDMLEQRAGGFMYANSVWLLERELPDCESLVERVWRQVWYVQVVECRVDYFTFAHSD